MLTDDSLRSGDVSGYGRRAMIDPPVVSANTYKVEHQAASAANTKYNTQLLTGGVQGQGDVYMSCVLVWTVPHPQSSFFGFVWTIERSSVGVW